MWQEVIRELERAYEKSQAKSKLEQGVADVNVDILESGAVDIMVVHGPKGTTTPNTSTKRRLSNAMSGGGSEASELRIDSGESQSTRGSAMIPEDKEGGKAMLERHGNERWYTYWKFFFFFLFYFYFFSVVNEFRGAIRHYLTIKVWRGSQAFTDESFTLLWNE